MTSNTIASSALLVIFNLLFFTLVTSNYVPCPPPPHKAPKLPPKYPKKPHVPKPPPSPAAHKPHPTPTIPKSAPPPPAVPKPTPTPTPTPTTTYPPPSQPHCPKDTLKLGACVNVLGNLLSIVLGTPPHGAEECCSLIEGIADAEAAVCLCTVIETNIGIVRLRVPVALSVLLNTCGKKVPKGFQCE